MGAALSFCVYKKRAVNSILSLVEHLIKDGKEERTKYDTIYTSIWGVGSGKEGMSMNCLNEKYNTTYKIRGCQSMKYYQGSTARIIYIYYIRVDD